MFATDFFLSASPATERPSVELINGAWIDEATGREVVGAKSITLGERFRPYEVARPGDAADWVQFSLSELESHPALAVLITHPAIVRLTGGTEPIYQLPMPSWQEIRDQAVAAWIPEFDSDGINQSLAAVERRVRAMKDALDELTRTRLLVLLLATRAGHSRRELSDITGLSLARIQQLIESPPEVAVAEVDGIIAEMRGIFGTADGPIRLSQIASRLGADRAEELIDHLSAVRLVEAVEDGLALTDDGRRALADTPATRGRDRTKV